MNKTSVHDDPAPPDETLYANQHIPKFLNVESSNNAEASMLQVITDGSQLTSKALLSDDPASLSINRPILVLDTPQSIGMKVPKPTKGESEVTVRQISEILGGTTPVAVIDVKHQDEMENWTLEDLVEFFEDEERLRYLSQRDEDAARSSSPTLYESLLQRPKRAAAAKNSKQQQSQRVLNQISLEFSHTPLAKLVASPKFVRDIDWIDHAWPESRRKTGDYPVVQYYCLTSTAGAYTDFHLDFGGTSVWYHVLSGEKVFVLIPPAPENLNIYENQWLCHKDQAALFLPDLLQPNSGLLKVTLKPSQTMMIPAGWIHAVYTPKDSVVLGGNFLHGLDMKLQLDVYCLEERAHVLERFRFPHFKPIMFYAGGMYLKKMKGKNDSGLGRREVEQLEHLIPCLDQWWKGQTDERMVPLARDAAASAGCSSVEDMLWQLKAERARRLGLEIPERPDEEPVVVKSEAAATAKPKIRLKLLVNKPENAESAAASPPRPPDTKSSPPRPKEPVRLRLKLSSSPEKAPSSHMVKTSAGDNEFRIIVPSTAKPTPPPALLQPQKRKIREDLDSYVTLGGVEDDEWQPDAVVSQKQQQSQAIRPSPSRPIKRTSPGASQQAQAKKATTSRQRLMKRLR